MSCNVTRQPVVGDKHRFGGAQYNVTQDMHSFVHKFIHPNLISCSLIGSLVNTWSVLKMSTALRVLRPDCTRCFWCVIVTSTDPFFSLGKVVDFLHV